MCGTCTHMKCGMCAMVCVYDTYTIYLSCAVSDLVEETEEGGGARKAGIWRSGCANVNGFGHLGFATLVNFSSEKPLRDDSWRTSGSFCVLSGSL